MESFQDINLTLFIRIPGELFERQPSQWRGHSDLNDLVSGQVLMIGFSSDHPPSPGASWLGCIQSWGPLSLMKFKAFYSIKFLPQIEEGSNYVSAKRWTFPHLTLRRKLLELSVQSFLIVFKVHSLLKSCCCSTTWDVGIQREKSHGFIGCHGNLSPLKQLLKYNCHG